MSINPPIVLRPLNIADILDHSIRIYRQNLGPFLGICAIVYVPVGITQMAAMYVMSTAGQSMGNNPSQIPWGQLGVMGVAVLSIMLVSLLAVPLGQGALSIAVSRRYLGEPVTVADAYRSIGSRWGVLIATVLLVGLAVGTGTLFCLVPGVYLGVLWMFAAPVIAIEGLGPMEAIKRSMALVEGEWWRVFGTYLLLTLLTSLVTSVIVYPVTILTMFTLVKTNVALAQAINQGVNTAVMVLVQPVLITGLVLMYYDLRVRKEGFDLELLAKAMGSTVPLPPKVEMPLYSAPPAAGYPAPPPLPPELAAPTSGVPLPPVPPSTAAPLPLISPEQLTPPTPEPAASADESALLPDDSVDDFKP